MEHLTDTCQQARTVIADLKQQSELENFGESVHRTVNEFAERLGLLASCEIEGDVSLPASSRKHLLAIIQEALTNSCQHGRARRAAVRVKTTGRDIEVERYDDGTGFDPEATPQEGHHGHTIMEERARIADGQLRLDSVLGRGTGVMVRLPGVVL
ncbi:MAG: ATP-binding protein [Actinobacteria bacterium]|nr:ATP-binding protein [Actinomycetota bacterium]MCA1739997.1 ATP-binding protein [Actinomycetota bacterium]